jgi:hypothetical protein
MARRGRSTPPHHSDVIREPSWEERQKQARKAQRRRRRPRPRTILGPILVIGLAGAVGVVVAGYAGRGPYASLVTSRDAAPSTEPVPTTTVLGGTSTTEFALDSRHYEPGDCVVWDQYAPPAAYHRTDVVPCGEDHVVEIAAGLTLQDPAEGGPTTPGWDERIRDLCRPYAERYLGAKLDPNGRYHVYWIAPLSLGWKEGDRQVWCGLGAGWSTTGPVAESKERHSALFREAVDRRTQFWKYEPGDCLAAESSLPVDCHDPHTEEVVGTITLPDDAVVPAESDHRGWADLVSDDCRSRARTYLGRSIPDDWQFGWMTIGAESWAAGAHTVTCFLGQWENDEIQTVTGSARGQTA